MHSDDLFLIFFSPYFYLINFILKKSFVWTKPKCDINTCISIVKYNQKPDFNFTIDLILLSIKVLVDLSNNLKKDVYPEANATYLQR